MEKELAGRLRNASRQERRYLYSSLYDELFRRIPYHPLLTRKSFPEQTAIAVSFQMKCLRRFLERNSAFLEIGPGDRALSFEVAKHVGRVYAVDVSEEITSNQTRPQNFELILSDGCSIPLPANIIDVAYSSQLLEHLHPDDALEQLHNIREVLVPGGVYICITPSRIGGPHDVSRYFDAVASGFHLKEYTTTELCDLLKAVGFSRVRAYVTGKGLLMRFPLLAGKLTEGLLSRLPHSLQRSAAQTLPFRFLLRALVVGTK